MIFMAYSSPRMNWILDQRKIEGGILAHPPSPPFSASFAPPSPSLAIPSSSGNKISPAVLFIIVILAVIFFISGLLHLLVRFLIKQPSSSSSSHSSGYPDISGSDALQRQLQQLFHLHDSGLDQAFIDALPVFLYKEIVGLKEPFDCAVCLCEFSVEDKLRLLPICSHAFHLQCIDTWLLSNSTCPLCRGTLFAPDHAIENPVFEFNDSREEDRVSCDGVDELHTSQKPIETAEIVSGKRVFSVRLGKFRSLTNGEEEKEGAGESSRGSGGCNLDARRCYSMGSFQYVVGDTNLQVALRQRRDGGDRQPMKKNSNIVNSPAELDFEGKKLSNGSKGESFSVSKIWLWSKGKLPSSSDTRLGISSNNHGVPVWIGRT